MFGKHLWHSMVTLLDEKPESNMQDHVAEERKQVNKSLMNEYDGGNYKSLWILRSCIVSYHVDIM
jgi:hypothetical protein